MWYYLLFEWEDFRDKNDYDNENEEKYYFPDLVEKYGGHPEKKSERVDEIPDEVLGHAHIEESVMEMMNTISRERVFFIVKSHQNDIEGINQVDSKDCRNGSDFPAGYDCESCYHKSNEHRPGFAEKYMGFYVVKPADENGGDENRETKKYKYRIGLGEGWLYIIWSSIQ